MTPACGAHLGLRGWPIRLGWIALLGLVGCVAAGVYRVPPASPPASIAFARAQSLLARGEDQAARASLEQAVALAPDWVAPARALDDLDREALLGPEVLAHRRAQLEQNPDDAGLHYLVGRLEGAAGVPRFERGRQLDPELAWNHHALAWNAHLSGARRGALRPGRRARDLSRDTWERSYFTVAAARYDLGLGRPDRAAALLASRLAEGDLLARDRVQLESWLAQAELQHAQPTQVERGYRRALELVGEPLLSDEDLVRLVRSVLEAPRDLRGGAGTLELASALARGEGELRARLRAGVLLEAGAPTLAWAMFNGEAATHAAAERLRAARFARGDGPQALEAWRAGLPAFLLDAEGLPRDPRLAELVRAGRAGEPRELGRALVAAGWFREARGLAEFLALDHLDVALELEAQASAGVVLLSGVDRILRLVDRGQVYGGPWASAGAGPGAPEPGSTARGSYTASRPIESLDGLLAALDPLFAGFHRALGTAEAAVDLSTSPRVSYGPAAEVVHPGPRFSAADAERGLGDAGLPVGGLAAELDRIGRFGIFGQAVGGGGPDGTLLRRVHVETRAGSHLGVPWSGLVAWCEGADVESRPGRRGARISGAALHEGYWIDLAAVREELVVWRRLEARFGADNDVSRAELERALSVRGVPDGGRPGALIPLLGAADRVRLAVLRDRREADPEAAAVTLDELALLTALHEEGHLCDRTRFLPLGKNLLGVLSLLVDGGFRPRGVARELEERAQLVCLAEAPDPRLPLADILAAAELGGSVTPHAAAYRELLVEWLALLEVLAREPGSFPTLERGRAYAHQLHWLTPEEVRNVSLALATRRGLVGDPNSTR